MLRKVLGLHVAVVFVFCLSLTALAEDKLRWEATGVKVDNASGTIVHYDAEADYAYVLSCGHIRDIGRKSRKELTEKPDVAKIVVYFHNEKKLDEPELYDGEMLCYTWNDRCQDVSLVRFQPSWDKPIVSPIAPLDTTLLSETILHNVGCDRGKPVADHLVRMGGTSHYDDGTQVRCSLNAGQPGRSGGGLLDAKWRVVGITSRSDFRSNTYFTTLETIHSFLDEEEFDFLLP